MPDKNSIVVYIEALNGVSGDMFLGALLDLEVPVEVFHDAWSALGVDNYEVEVSETRRSGLKATRCRVRTDEAHGPRTWKEYEKLLRDSTLKPSIRDDALKLCRRLFDIEAQFHGLSLQRMHLHEMGGSDLLIDVVGTLAAFDHLAPDRVVASPVNTGRGFIRFSHGSYPVPAPATAQLLKGVPIFQNEADGELATPTGALLLTHLAAGFGVLPEMQLQRIGIGAGERETDPCPNVLRLFAGKTASTSAERVVMIESNIDDCSPQLLGAFLEIAFEHGALDVFFTPIQMKKNRPATRVSILADASRLQTLSDILFRETTAIGLRYWPVERMKLERRDRTVKVGGRHTVRIKESLSGTEVLNFQPEYEDCRKAARESGRPVKQIIAEALAAYHRDTP